MSVYKQMTTQVAAGGAAGIVDICILYPLDVVKTRLQIQSKPMANILYYENLPDCFQKIYASEGVPTFYRGILLPILSETPKRATNFFAFEQYKRLLSTNSHMPQPGIFFLAGLCSGFTEALVVCPFEVVKIRLQAERRASSTANSGKGTWQMAKQIYNTGGLGRNGLYLGLPSTLGRQGVGGMIYFGMYHSVRSYYPPPQQSSTANYLYRFLLAFAAGAMAGVANLPFDVSKSRIQGPQPIPGRRKYYGCFQTLALTWKEEGFSALFKGMTPKIIRLGSGGAIMMLVFETVTEFCNGHF